MGRLDRRTGSCWRGFFSRASGSRNGGDDGYINLQGKCVACDWESEEADLLLSFGFAASLLLGAWMMRDAQPKPGL